jgi:hypothetical protein
VRDGGAVTGDGEANALAGRDCAKATRAFRLENRFAVNVCDAVAGSESGAVRGSARSNDADLGWD